MRISLTVDRELLKDLKDAESLTREKKSTLVRLALRLGLAAVVNRFQGPRPEGYFAQDYAKGDAERIRLENSYAKALVQRPER